MKVATANEAKWQLWTYGHDLGSMVHKGKLILYVMWRSGQAKK